MNALDRHRERDAVQRRRRQQLGAAYDIARRERARGRWYDKPLPANHEEHAALRHAAQGGLIAGPARDEHTAAVVSLLELGADPDRPAPSDGLTPLQAACSVGHTGAVRALLEAKVCTCVRIHDAGVCMYACMYACMIFATLTSTTPKADVNYAVAAPGYEHGATALSLTLSVAADLWRPPLRGLAEWLRLGGGPVGWIRSPRSSGICTCVARYMHMRGGMVHTRSCPTYTHPAAWGEGSQRRRAGIAMGPRPRVDARVWWR